MKLPRRHFLHLAASAAALPAVSRIARAQAYPSRLVRIIAGFPAVAFDAYPFNFLTMCVSLEAIFLSVFVLLSQNRQAAKDRVRSDVEYDVNLKAELEIAHLHEKVDRLTGDVLSRLERVHALLPKNTDVDTIAAEVRALRE